MFIKIIIISFLIVTLLHHDIYGQLSNDKISIGGIVNNLKFKIDQGGTEYSLFELDGLDSLYLNGIYFNNWFGVANGKDLKKIVFCNYINNSINHLIRIQGKCIPGDLAVDNFNNSYIAIYSYSDSLYINDSLFFDTGYENAVLLFKFNRDFDLTSMTNIVGAGPVNLKLSCNNSFITLLSTYCDTLVIGNVTKTCAPISTGNVNSFICNLSLNFDTIYSVITAEGNNLDNIQDFTYNDNNILFCGQSNSKILILGNDSILKPNDNFKARIFIGSISQYGLLNWFYQTECTENETVNSINVLNSNTYGISGEFLYSEIRFDQFSLFNLKANRKASFLVRIDTEGKILGVHDYNNSGNVALKRVLIDNDNTKWGLFTSLDTIIDVSGNIHITKPYGNYYFCELNENFEILKYNYFTSSKELGINNILLDEENNIMINPWYLGDSLFYNNKFIYTDSQSNLYVNLLFELKKLVIENTNNSGNELVLNIYPNPTTSIITVALGNIIRQNMQFELVDIFGQSVIKKYLENKIIKFDFNLEYLEDGLYFLKISEPLGLIHSGKIVKISVF